MADLFTTAYSPRGDWGYRAAGRLSRAEVIERYREHARRQLADAQAVLDTPDDEFDVCQHRGVYRPRDLVDLLPDGSAVRRGG